MGVPFIEHMGGAYIYSCRGCGTSLTNKSQLQSQHFTGSSGTAYLFRKVVNVTYSDAMDRRMMTGLHIVRDVNCKKCNGRLGWMYEFAYPKAQEYKEGRFVLERALMTAEYCLREYN